MTTSKTLVSLQFASSDNYEANLKQLLTLVDAAPENAIIVAPEVALSGFDYEHFDEAADFTYQAQERIALHVKEKTLIMTFIEKHGSNYYNVAKVFHNGHVIHEQGKHKLFALGDEHKHFRAAPQEALQSFSIDGIKITILICFELRFKSLWQRCEGSDIIAVPSRWGKLRSQHFVSLTNALAIMNQCYVIASDASNEDCSAQSGIITPFGEERRNKAQPLCSQRFDAKEIRKMRRYLDVGIASE